jgi:hypothetical protein
MEEIMLKTEKNHRVHAPFPKNAAEKFCGIFKHGPSLIQALLAERKKERERKDKISDDSTRTIPCHPEG